MIHIKTRNFKNFWFLVLKTKKNMMKDGLDLIESFGILDKNVQNAR